MACKSLHTVVSNVNSKGNSVPVSLESLPIDRRVLRHHFRASK